MRPGWTIHVEIAGDPNAADHRFEDQLCDLVDALADHGGAVSGSTNHDRYGATFSIDTDSPCVTEIIDQALLVFHEAAIKADLPPWPVVRCDVMTYAEHDAELERPT